MSDPPTQTPEQKLTQPVQFIKGVGPQRAELLEKLGIRTAADLLFFFPRDYQDFTELHQIIELANDQLANLVGIVDDIDQMVTASGKHILYVLVKQDKQFVRAVWFNQSFLTQKFQLGQRVLLRGKAKLSGGRFQMNHPRVTWLDSEQTAEKERRLHADLSADRWNQSTSNAFAG